MNPAPTLNEARAHTWAAGAGWVGGKSGPLICWAMPGEGKGWGNVAAHFGRFYWAARGRVRPSVRWKTGKAWRRVRKLGALKRAANSSDVMKRRAEGRTGFTGQAAGRTVKERREARRFIKQERREDRLRDIAPADLIDRQGNFTGGIDIGYLEFLHSVCIDFHKPIEMPKSHLDYIFYCNFGNAFSIANKDYLPRRALTYAIITANKKAIRGILDRVRADRITIAALLRFLERDAYRVHLARKVKARRRPPRAPRPLYARPRPPTSPLAPPLR